MANIFVLMENVMYWCRFKSTVHTTLQHENAYDIKENYNYEPNGTEILYTYLALSEPPINTPCVALLPIHGFFVTCYVKKIYKVPKSDSDNVDKICSNNYGTTYNKA